MRLYNLTDSILSLRVENIQVRVEPRTSSSNIVLTPNVIKGSLLPLINLYNEKILVVLNTQDALMTGQPNCGIPAENVVDYQTADKALNREIKQWEQKNKKKLADLAKEKANSEINDNNETNKIPEDIIPEIKIIPGTNKQ